jgi:hypothetical protein
VHVVGIELQQAIRCIAGGEGFLNLKRGKGIGSFLIFPVHRFEKIKYLHLCKVEFGILFFGRPEISLLVAQEVQPVVYVF